MLGGVLLFYPNFNRTFYKQTVETLIAASGLGLYYLPTSQKKTLGLYGFKGN